MGDFLKLLAAIVIVGGGAGAFLTWNFEQNEEFRPYEGYSEEALDDLAEAFGAKLEALDGRYEKVTGRDVRVQDHPLIGERVDEFERVQRIAAQKRQAGYEVSYAMADQKNLERELWIRAHPIEHFWNTATQF